MTHTRKFILGLLTVLALVAAGCGSQADTVSHNLSVEAEKFNVERRIVGVNAITDKVEFLVVGRCSIEEGLRRSLEITCKQGPHDYRKHYVGMADNVFFVATQLKGLDVSEYRTEIILRPQAITPNFDLVGGK